MARRLSPVLLATLCGGAAMAQPRPAPPHPDSMAHGSRPGWVLDGRNGCWVWREEPGFGLAVSWSGACPGGPATGEGVLVWEWTTREGERRRARWRATLDQGRVVGTPQFLPD